MRGGGNGRVTGGVTLLVAYGYPGITVAVALGFTATAAAAMDLVGAEDGFGGDFTRTLAGFRLNPRIPSRADFL